MVLLEKVRAMIDGDMQKPLIVSVMGQTGVGKSSLINALFGTDLLTDAVRPGTTEVKPIEVTGKSGHLVTFYDLPGVGESEQGDLKWVPEYRQHLKDADVALWAVLAEHRAFVYDLKMLKLLIEGLENQEQTRLLSKIVFVLTKVDLLTDPPTPTNWDLVRAEENKGFFVANQFLENLIERKKAYFRDVFIAPFKDLIRGQTYYKGTFTLQIPHLHYEKGNSDGEGNVYYDGFLGQREYDGLSNDHPEYEDMFRRLYECYNAVPCSAHLRYNLDLLTNVIISKLNTHSAGRFEGFVEKGPMDRMPYDQAKSYTNIVIRDEPEKKR